LKEFPDGLPTATVVLAQVGFETVFQVHDPAVRRYLGAIGELLEVSNKVIIFPQPKATGPYKPHRIHAEVGGADHRLRIGYPKSEGST
jgi:hypothetical protein